MSDVANIKVYLAAPFFNPAQLGVVVQLEQMMDFAKIPYISPRKQHSGPSVAINSIEHAAQVFKRNTTDMDDCTHMLAVLNWFPAPGTEVCLIEHNLQTGPKPVLSLDIPDSGVVFEMGYFHGKGGEIVAYCPRKTKQLNVMLSAPTVGVAHTLEDLRAYFKDPENHTLRKFQGESL